MQKEGKDFFGWTHRVLSKLEDWCCGWLRGNTVCFGSSVDNTDIQCA